MTKRYVGKTFEHFEDRGKEKTYSDLEFVNCTFQHCGFYVTPNPARRSTIRNVRIEKCVNYSASIDCAILDNVTVQGLRTPNAFPVSCAVFRHVILSGKMNTVWLSRRYSGSKDMAKRQLAYDEANAAFYSDVDWALDISGLQCSEFDNDTVPPELIRRDPETQFLFRRERLLDGKFRKVKHADEIIGLINVYLKGDLPSFVIAAPKMSRKYKEELQGLHALRDAGFTEPD